MSKKRDQWEMLGVMIQIVSEAFKDDVDKGGKPYVLHCLEVMYGVDQTDPEQMQIAMGHDLPEDKPEYTKQVMKDLGFSERVVEGCHGMKHRPGESYDDYIKRISLDPKDLTPCKLSDLRHNSDITRLKGVRKKDFDRLEKYNKSYIYLSN